METGMVPDVFPRQSSRTLQNLWGQRQNLVLEDGVLYRQWLDVPGKGSHSHLQLVLPHQLIQCCSRKSADYWALIRQERLLIIRSQMDSLSALIGLFLVC